MTKYNVVIEETVVEEFELDAESKDEALKIAEKKYHDGDFVLSPGEVQFKRMSIVSSKNENSEWIEF